MILRISLSVLVLTSVIMVTSVRDNQMQMEEKLGEKLVAAKNVNSGGVTLLDNVFLQVTEFECARGSAVCRAWRAVNLLEALEMAQLNCTTTPSHYSSTTTPAAATLCVRARELLGADNLSHQQIKEGLFEVGEGVPVEDYPWLNAIRDAVVDYVCVKDPEECPSLRKFVELENQLEDSISKKKKK